MIKNFVKTGIMKLSEKSGKNHKKRWEIQSKNCESELYVWKPHEIFDLD